MYVGIKVSLYQYKGPKAAMLAVDHNHFISLTQSILFEVQFIEKKTSLWLSHVVFIPERDRMNHIHNTMPSC